MFRWHVNHDLDLAKEVVSVKPKTNEDWKTIASNLENAWPNVPNRPNLKGRSCKEHFDVMLGHHKLEDAAALKKYVNNAEMCIWCGVTSSFFQVLHLIVFAFNTDTTLNSFNLNIYTNLDNWLQRIEIKFQLELIPYTCMF